MKLCYLSICVSLLFCCNLTAIAVDYNDKILSLLLQSNKSLNGGGVISADSLFKQCGEIEAEMRAINDYESLHIVELIMVNALCLKGDFEQSADKARKMYDAAIASDSDRAKAFAIQAIGYTFFYSNQYNRAKALFAEAEALFVDGDDDISKIRLFIQQLHTFYTLNEIAAMPEYLAKVKNILDNLSMDEVSDFYLYFLCYKALYNIETNNIPEATANVTAISLLDYPKNVFYKRWYYYAMSRYYLMEHSYDAALAMTDSTLNIIKTIGSNTEYTNMLTHKADMLVILQRYEDACTMYNEAWNLVSSLESNNYNRQIESLHMVYWVDKMKIDNIAAHNKLLVYILISAIIALMVSIVVVVRIRRRNAKLEESHKKLDMARQTASESIQSKSLFLSNMSHDLRTPLNAIVGFTDILTDSDEVDAETKQMCGEYIKQNSDLLLKLFNDIIDLSALNENKFSFTFENCDVVALCRNVIETINKVKNTAATVGFESSISTLNIYTDGGRLQQVLINLLINATKFTEQGNITLRLGVDNDNREVVFTVEDTGCGIPIERQKRIFERFEKLHEGIQGVGLGLSICRLIVDRFGGRIWIDSEYTDGARFIFTHPLDQYREL